MKRSICLFLVSVMLFSMTACSNVSDDQKVVTDTDVSTEEIPENSSDVLTEETVDGEQQEETETAPVAPKSIAIGETVVTTNYEFTLKKVELSYDVEPDNPPSYYSHYAAESGMVYLHIDADIKNTQKQNLECDEVYQVKADYNGGYMYSGFAVAEDDDGDFTYANITSISPLQTLGVHNLVSCPQEVETSTNSLKITIVMSDETEYEYIIR